MINNDKSCQIIVNFYNVKCHPRSQFGTNEEEQSPHFKIQNNINYQQDHPIPLTNQHVIDLTKIGYSIQKKQLEKQNMMKMQQ